MSEPLRTPSDAAPANEAEREASIERLLLAGLDHYFAGKYEQAVNVWTRVAFLERGHGRARAYIERARGALAEQQRQTEELLHRGIAAYDAGNVQDARDLLTRAIAEGGANETALVLLQRLGRLERADPDPSAATGAGADLARRPRLDAAPPRMGSAPGTTSPTVRASWLATALVSVAVAGGILLAAQPIASWLGERPIAGPSIESRPDEPLPIVRASEMRLARARDLYRGGRLNDALRLLEQIEGADPMRPEADRLKADVQRDLLATVEQGPLPAAAGAAR